MKDIMTARPLCLRALFVLCSLQLCYPSFADGGLFQLQIGDEPTVETAQRALLHVQEADADAANAYRIDFYLDVAYEGDGGDFAWVVPTPTLPTVSMVEEGFFDELDALTRPVIFYMDHSQRIGCSLARPLWGEGTPTDDVIVWGTDTIGPYDYAILTAAGSEGLGAWLEDNGYVLPIGADAVLDYYVQKQSYFVAFKLNPFANEGPLSAVCLTYGADEIVYPLHITTLSTAEKNQVTLHVMGCFGVDPVNATVTDIDRDSVVVNAETQSSNYETLFAETVTGSEGPVLVRESELDFQHYQYRTENAQLNSLLSHDVCSCVVRYRTLLSADDMVEDISFVLREPDYLGTTIYAASKGSKIRLSSIVLGLPVLLSWYMLRARKRKEKRRAMPALLVLLLPLIVG
ncbi:MAG: DUF2330 domain-containing protein [Candidatus Hydrogenedentota bacterium]